MLNFGKTVADCPHCAKYPAASGFPLIGALRGGAGESAVNPHTNGMNERLSLCLRVHHVRMRV